MSLETKKISELELLTSLSDEANVLVEEGGSTKRIPANSIGKVKTVNGAEPDENGNVEIENSEGFSGSWNDLTDKPFYKEITIGEVIFDEVVTGFTGTPSETDENVVISAQCSNGINIKFNKKYRVTFDGVQYLFESENDGYSNPTLGCSYDYMVSDYEPYFHINSNGTIRTLGKVGSEHSIKIELCNEDIRTIDLEFLPDGYPGKKKIGDYALLNETPIEFSEYTSGVYYASIRVNKLIEGHKTYVVIIDDVTYSVTPEYSTPDSCFIGAKSMYALTEDVPFSISTIIYNYNPSAGIYLKTDTASHTIKIIEKDSDKVICIDPKYISKAWHVPNAAGETPTAEEFNELLNSLRRAGFLKYDP